MFHTNDRGGRPEAALSCCSAQALPAGTEFAVGVRAEELAGAQLVIVARAAAASAALSARVGW